MKLKNVLFVIAIVAILGLTFAGTHVAMSQYTATEWDEPVYTDIVRGVLIQGEPSFVTGEAIRRQYYAANPPLHFFVLSIWDRLFYGGVASIDGHRVYSSFAATLTVGMAMLCVYILTRRRRVVLLTGVLLATDGWFAYTSLLVKLDTSAICIGLMGVSIFYSGLLSKDMKKQQSFQFWGGAVMGLAAAYKHVAVVYVIALFFHWMYYRFWLGKRDSYHGQAIRAGVYVLVAYVSIMLVTVGDDYSKATFQQILRTTGNRSSNGLNPSLATMLQVLMDTYVAFLGSVGISIFGGMLAVISVVFAMIGLMLERSEVRKEKRKNSDFVGAIFGKRIDAPLSYFYSLTFTSIGLLTVIQLRNPHYLGYAIVPIVIVVASWLDRSFDGNPKLSVRLTNWTGRQINLSRSSKVLASGLFIAFMVLNVRTILIRVFEFGSEVDVLDMTTEVILARVPLGSRVVGNEPVCRSLAPYDYDCVDFREVIHQKELSTYDPDVIAIYTTPTTRQPQSDAISNLLGNAGPEDLLGQFSGWKHDNVAIIWVSSKNKPFTP